MTTFSLQLNTQEQHIVFIPAPEGPTKVRPVGFEETAAQVVTLEEADRSYRLKYGHELPELPERDQSDCVFNNCEFEFYPLMAKYKAIQFFIG